MTMPPSAPDPRFEPPGSPTQDAGYTPYQPAGYPAQPVDTANPYVAPTPYTGPGAPPSGMPAPRSGNTRGIGLIGVALLYVLAIWQLVLPTISVFVGSMSAGSSLMGQDRVWVGFDNWSRVMPLLSGSVPFTLLATVPVMIAALVLGMAIGTAMPAFSRTSTVVRVLVGVLGAMFVPLGVGLSRMLSTDTLGSASGARSFLMVTITLAWLPLLTAVFATAFGAAFSPQRRNTVALVAVVGLLAIVPVALQLFDLPMVLTNGGPQDSTTTPLLIAYQQGLQYFELGVASAVSAMVFLVAAVLGLLAVALVVASRVRLAPVPPALTQQPRSGLLGAIVAAVVLVIAVVTIWPVLTRGTAGVEDVRSTTELALTTWGPVALGTALQVLVAVLGGAAIGWCGPLGRSSLWLLLPLAPWLFVSPDLLLISSYETMADSGLINTWVALVPHPKLVVGAVVVFALLFAGLRESGPRPQARLVLSAAAGVGGVLFLVQGQSIMRSLVLVIDPELYTAPQMVMQAIWAFGGANADVPLGLLYPIPVLLLVVALGVAAQLGLKRVALVRG